MNIPEVYYLYYNPLNAKHNISVAYTFKIFCLSNVLLLTENCV